MANAPTAADIGRVYIHGTEVRVVLETDERIEVTR